MVGVAVRSRESAQPHTPLLPIPTLRELAESDRDLARVTRRTMKGEPSHYALTDAGTKHLSDLMRENGRRLRALDETRPAIVSQPLLTPAQEAYIWMRDAAAEIDAE
jgi:hypothetical protein